MSWRYTLLRGAAGSCYVCERYDIEIPNGAGDRLWTGPITPFGETPADLLQSLRMMVRDIEHAIEHNEIIEDKELIDV